MAASLCGWGSKACSPAAGLNNNNDNNNNYYHYSYHYHQNYNMNVTIIYGINNYYV